jgi:hypothetical protein
MRVKPQHLFFILIPLLAGLQACKPDKPEPQKYLGTYPLGDIKDYLYFKPGSMWVYECDSTGELDTQVMVQCDTPWIIKSFVKYQQLTFTVKSLNEGSIYNNYNPGLDIFYRENWSYFWSITRFRTNPKNGGGTDCVFFKPYDTNSLGGFGSSSTYYKGLISKMTVLGKDYDSVRVFQVKTGGSFPYCKIKTWNAARLTFYWAKNVGLISLHIETLRDGFNTPINFNWHLKEFKII